MPMPATLGSADLLTFLPPILMTSNIVLPNSTAIALADARIAGSTDPNYGTEGWLPRLDGGPFAILKGNAERVHQLEVSRLRSDFLVDIFIAICEADTPGVTVSFNDQANRWRDVMRQLVIPPNRRISPSTLAGWPINGDVIWEQVGSQIKEREDVLGIAYYGVLIQTIIHFDTIVAFQG